MASGSSRFSPRNLYVAEMPHERRLATLLTRDEEADDLTTAKLRFDIALLAERLAGITDWLRRQPDTRDSSVGTAPQARVPARRSWRQRGGRIRSARSFRGVGGRISPVWRCPA
jgi:hypothetical protein